MQCPCCGSAMAPNLLPDQLAHLAMSHLQRTVLTFIVSKYPAQVPVEVLIDHLYQLDPNGGPSDPRNNLNVHIFRINRHLRPLGWEIVTAGYNARILTRTIANAA